MNENFGILLRRSSNNISISEFYENESLNKYDYNPPYQRKGDVWGEEKQSFLIDTILKNYPIPPIFLHAETDAITGKTRYHVIDGKQRLNAIIRFIKNEITVPENFGDDKYGTQELNGLTFEEISPDSLFKQNFWKYSIPIEYVDTSDVAIINNIFDRLNRNGEPLNPQELRNAKYENCKFMNLVKQLSNNNFWYEKLDTVTKSSRMEDDEFISELLFTILEGIVDAKDKENIDLLYAKWVPKLETDSKLVSELIQKFNVVTEFLSLINLDYSKYKIKGVSHLYGLWGFSIKCIETSILPSDIEIKLNEFFTARINKETNTFLENYKNSMSYNTKSKSQRTKRVNALYDYCTN